ncbi:hypothetical protein LCGC14_1804000 [marine sediment metagenome]|uniref:Uncharacterized protein n=1 Tax=marine sediment metagenome TaxID=412755 RepID=A0A0F9GNP0_9ZZZZ
MADERSSQQERDERDKGPSPLATALTTYIEHRKAMQRLTTEAMGVPRWIIIWTKP